MILYETCGLSQNSSPIRKMAHFTQNNTLTNQVL